MAIAKPTKIPQWTVNVDGSDNDVADPTSGQNNVVEPPAGKKLLGWDFKEKPPRNWFNWLSRLTAQWFLWLSEQTAPVGKFSGSSPDYSGSPSFDFEYRRVFDMVFLTIPVMTGTAVDTDFVFPAVIPAAIRPSGQRLCGITGAMADFGSGEVWANTQVIVNSSGDIIFLYAQRTDYTFNFSWPNTGSRQLIGVTIAYTLSLTP